MDDALLVLLVFLILSIPFVVTGLLVWRFGFRWWMLIVFFLLLMVVVFSFFRKGDDGEELPESTLQPLRHESSL